jgi:small subunit ribosomal protein S2
MLKEKKSKKEEFLLDLQEMEKAGLYFGHRSSRCHPKMKPYIIGVKGSDHINIINLEKTKEKLKEALDFIKKLAQEKKILLLVGTKLPIRELVEEIARECGLPYVNQRWLGGTLTNFLVIKKRIDYFNELERKKEAGEFKKYTKLERLKLDKELERLKMKFGGIKNLKDLPDAIFVVDMRKDDLAVKEARRVGIPVVAIADTNVDPTLADFPIPANDDARSSVRYILEKVKEAIQKGQKEGRKEPAKEEEE